MSVKEISPRLQSSGVKARPAWMKKWFNQEVLIAFLFILPSLFGMLTFVIWPTLKGFSLSFTSATLTRAGEFIGLENYQKLLTDNQFRQSVLITARYVLLNIPLQTVIALGMAVLISRLTNSTIIRGIIFLPYLFPMLMVTIIWMSILDYLTGPINGVLKLLLGPSAMIGFLNVQHVIASLAWINTWRHAGYNTLLFFAGLQGIPKEFYESAALDGASEWQLFRSITLPLLRPVMVFVLVTSVIGSFQVFDSAMVIGSPPGGPGGATRVIYWYITSLAFNQFKMGYATAVAAALFAFSMLIAWLQLRWFKADVSDLA
ncbi:MAG: sugar ABC transporter permease [Chloroflexota bacterium]|nr:MAG: sugar ABC transporter permease [Chloroflexota bacterium]